MTLIACSHGTRSAAGRATVAALVELVRGLVPDTDVQQAFVDVEEPEVDAVVAAAASDPVVVPLLLSRGFHTGVDIARAVRSREGARQTPPLGPHPLLAEVLADRIRDATSATGLGDGDHVVLAAAGSTAAVAAEDVEAMAELLRERTAVPVTIGYAAGAEPRIAAAIDAARTAGADRVIAASYVLAPGYFADVVASGGADIVTEVIGADPRVAQIVVERFTAS